MANIERLKQVLNLIKKNPRHWNQKVWHCGTSHCFAGFADCLAAGVSCKEDTKNIVGENISEASFTSTGVYVDEAAIKWLDLTKTQAEILFKSSNSLETLETIIENIERNLL